MSDINLDFVGPGARLALAAAKRAEDAEGVISGAVPAINDARDAAIADVNAAGSAQVEAAEAVVDGIPAIMQPFVDSASSSAAQAATLTERNSYLGKSARFPIRNRHNGDGSPFAMIAQPVANVGTWFNADGTLLLSFTIPRERTRTNTSGQANVSRTLMGNRLVSTTSSAHNFYLGIGGAANVYQTRIEFFMRSNATSQVSAVFLIPESMGSRLLLAIRRASGTLTIDVWDCDTGTKHAGPTLDASAFTGWQSAGLGGFFQIGSGGNTNVAPNVPSFNPTLSRCWEGEIGIAGYHTASLDDAACQAIALGTPLDTATAPAAWRWVREFDGTAASLSKPGWATGDATSPAQEVADRLSIDRGSSIVARNSYITLDRKIAGDAHVDAVIPGQNSKAVLLSGKVRALPADDVVEARFLTTDGTPVTNWQRVTPVLTTDTTWSGYVNVPKGPVPYVRQVRLASQRNDARRWTLDATRFGVGYRVLIIGQSQVANLRSSNRGLTYSGRTRFSFIQQSAEAAATINEINCQVIHDRYPAPGDGVVGIMNAIDAAGVDAVVALEIQAVGGTGAIDWITDSQTNRSWTPMLRSNEVMDGGRSTVVWNWDANDIGNNYYNELDAVFCGTGPLAGNHYVFGPLADGGTQVGATVTYMPVLRTNGGSGTATSDFDISGGWGTRREEGLGWAATKPFAVVGVSPVDMELSDWAHPSLTLAAGTERHGQHVGLSIVRGLRQDSSLNPAVSANSFAFTDGTRTAFTFDVNLPNFGRLTNGLAATSEAGADKEARVIEVSSDGGATWTRSGFTALITGRARVTVTKSSGNWAAGLKVRVGYGGVGAYGESGLAGNVPVRDYWMYDGYARHINGRGIPVLPSNTIYTVA